MAVHQYPTNPGGAPAGSQSSSHKAPSYSKQEAAAYAMARLPAAFAAVLRVLREVQARAPSCQLRSMLDLGSGPGTAIWAAQEVCIPLTPEPCMHLSHCMHT